jgi:hypothetical protein
VTPANLHHPVQHREHLPDPHSIPLVYCAGHQAAGDLGGNPDRHLGLDRSHTLDAQGDIPSHGRRHGHLHGAEEEDGAGHTEPH